MVALSLSREKVEVVYLPNLVKKMHLPMKTMKYVRETFIPSIVRHAKIRGYSRQDGEEIMYDVFIRNCRSLD